MQNKKKSNLITESEYLTTIFDPDFNKTFHKWTFLHNFKGLFSGLF